MTRREIVVRSTLVELVAAGALMLAGCVSAPEKDVAVYREVLDAQMTPPVAQAVDAPLDLAQALRLAVAHDERLASVGETYLQTVIARDRVMADFLPSIQLAPGFHRQAETALAAENPLVSRFVPTQTLDVPLELKLRDLNPKESVDRQSAADHRVAAQQATLLHARATLLAEVAVAYLGVLRAEERARVLATSEEMRQEQLADASARVHAGTSLALDASQAESQLAGTRTQRLAAEHDVTRARRTLAWLIGEPMVGGPLAPSPELPSGSWDAEALATLAENQRLDLLAAREGVEAAAADIRTAWDGYLPTVSLDLAYFLQRQSFPTEVNWTSMISLNVPLFSRGLVDADVRSAYSRWRQAALTELRLRRALRHDLAVTLENLGYDQRQEAQSAIRQTTAHRAEEQAEAARHAGLATHLDVLQARDEALEADLLVADWQFALSLDHLHLLCQLNALDDHPGAWGDTLAGLPTALSSPSLLH